MPRKRDRPDRTYRRRSRRPQATTVLMPEIIGTLLALHRRDAGMRQIDMAEDLDWPQSLVSKLERGDINPSVEQLDAMAEAIALELSGDDGDATRLRAWQVLQEADEVADALMDEGFDLVWTTGPLYAGPGTLLRGRSLVRRVRGILE